MKAIPITAGLLLASSLYAQEKPNIVVYLADDHGCAQSEPYGDTFIKTPKMQELADQGMLFENAYIASPASGPSRAALLSGMIPVHNGAVGNHRLPRPESQKMVKQLQEQGYEVVAFGKIAHGKKHAELCGFDELEWYNWNSDTKLSESVSAYLKKRTSQKPLCLMVGDHRPHVPWGKESIYNPAEVNLPDYLIDTKETREHWARYLSDITRMDKTMTEIDQMATDYFGNNNFVFIYSADHGCQWPFGKWNLYELGVRVPFIVRWPGQIEAGVRSNAMISWIDFMPTLIDLAGGKVSDDVDGRSFAPVLLGNTKKHRNLIFTTHNSDGDFNLYPIRAVRNERFKYIRNLLPDCYHSNHSDILRKDGAGAYWDSWDEVARNDKQAAAIINRYYRRPAIELYDLKKDPGERHNLADDPKYKKELKKMSDLLDKWLEEEGDDESLDYAPYPLNGPTPHQVHQAREVNKKKNKK